MLVVATGLSAVFACGVWSRILSVRVVNSRGVFGLDF